MQIPGGAIGSAGVILPHNYHLSEPEALLAKQSPLKRLRRVQFPTGSFFLLPKHAKSRQASTLPWRRSLTELSSPIAMQLELSRSTIRSLRPDDAPSLAKHIGTYSVARNMAMIPHPYSLKDAEEWISIATSRTPETHFAITINDEVVGGIGVEVGDPRGIARNEHCAEIGYWIGETCWGRGIMSEAVPALTEWAFSELRLIRLYAVVYARNPTSARVLAKAGYDLEGTMRARYFRDGEYIDGLLYAKLRLPVR